MYSKYVSKNICGEYYTCAQYTNTLDDAKPANNRPNSVGELNATSDRRRVYPRMKCDRIAVNIRMAMPWRRSGSATQIRETPHLEKTDFSKKIKFIL